MIDSTDEWIQTRSGIRERRWASDDETIEMMSLAAARKAVRAGRHRRRPDRHGDRLHRHPPATRPRRSPRPSPASSGAKSAAAFDISAACAGFCYAAAMADSFIRTGASKYVLIIGVERLSDMTDQNDRSTAFLFADGAGAAVIGPERHPGHRPGGLGLRRRPGRPDQPDRAVEPGRGDHRPRTSRALAGAADGGQPGLQVGLLHDGQDRRRSPRPGRRPSRGPRRLRPPPGQHAHHRRHVPRPEAALVGGRRPATSPPRATPRPPPSRSPSRRCWSPARRGAARPV